MSHQKLILQAFDKAFASLRSQGAAESKTAAAETLSNYLDEHFQFSFTERRLRDYYNAAEKGEEIYITQQAVRDGLAIYLGFADFHDWSQKNPIPTPPKVTLAFIISFFRRNRTTFSFIFAGLIVLAAIQFFTKERWMVWENGQFVEVPYNKEEFERRNFVVFDKEKTVHFKKINPDCTTEFFNPQGQALIWYGKNNKGELEFFTAPGNHPETEKHLKPITKYMIRKYICPSK
ncbi:MAG TPA: hypothetical protein VFF21_10255 [Flavobacteriaceae bacterium]|nr:hypothetical protein [Flavobacteriaceae bacterium]